MFFVFTFIFFKVWLERKIRTSVSSDFTLAAQCTNLRTTSTLDTSLLTLASPDHGFEVTCKLSEFAALARLDSDNWFSLLRPACLAHTTLVIELVIGKLALDLGELNQTAYDPK